MSKPSLVLAAFGSQYSPKTDRPVYYHVDRIREKNLFHEVRAGFYKEEPALREILRTLSADEVYVVPFSVSEGLFTEDTIPDELRLTSSQTLDVDKTVHITKSVGVHPSMSDAIINRIQETIDRKTIPESWGIGIVGHGTYRNPNHAKAVQDHAERIRARTGVSQVQELYLDQEPYVSNAIEHMDADRVVMVPYFMARGFHAGADIPMAIGLIDERDQDIPVPSTVDNKKIWYTKALGFEDFLTDLIIQRTSEYGFDPSASSETSNEIRDTDSLTGAQQEFFDQFDDQMQLEWGQLHISQKQDVDTVQFTVRHRKDGHRDADELRSYSTIQDARELARRTEKGDYRPLRGTADLQRGWIFQSLSPVEMIQVVEQFYPASIENVALHERNELDVTHFQDHAERLNGFFGVVKKATDVELTDVVASHCTDENCLRNRQWDRSETNEIDVSRGNGRLPCREPCSVLVSACRKVIVNRGDNENGHGHDHGHDHNHSHDHDHDHSHDHDHNHDHDHDHGHDHGNDNNHDHDHGHSHDHGNTHSHSHHD